MPKWTDYTIKTTVADNDEVMALDTAGKANKRLSLSTLSDWVLGKIADKVFEELQTNDKTILGAINELNSNTKYSASLTQSQRIEIEENSIQEITFYKFGRLVSVFINISVKAFHPSTTDFADICDVPDDYLPTHNLIVNYVTQVGTPMLFQIHPLKKKVSVYGVNELKNNWLIRQVFTYISKA